MKNFLLIPILIFFLAAVVWITNKNINSGHTYPEPSVAIGNKLIRVEIADDIAKQTQGLSDRLFLAENTGMLFVFPTLQKRHFWMKNMNFPLDIIWIAENKIKKIDKNLPPEKDQPKTVYDSFMPVNYVLEVNAGWAEDNNIKVGDEVKINL